jgi:hypothetical protein
VTERGANLVLSRWRARNYTGVKVDPRAVIRMPDTQRDARTKSLSERLLALHSIIKAEKESGCVVTQERANTLAAQLDVPPPQLAATPPGAQSFAYDQENGVITIGERRQELGKPPSDRDHMTIPQFKASLEAPPPTGAEPSAPKETPTE